MRISAQGLRVFLSILDHGSLLAAGRDLGMTQSALSNHLHTLEERFGVRLLTRGRLIVGASSTPGELLMPKLAVEFSARYPDVTLDVRVDDTRRSSPRLCGATSRSRSWVAR